MADLLMDTQLGQILRHFHQHSKPTAMIGHGPAFVAKTFLESAPFGVFGQFFHAGAGDLAFLCQLGQLLATTSEGAGGSLK